MQTFDSFIPNGRSLHRTQGSPTFGHGAFFEKASFGDGANFEAAAFGDRTLFREANFGHEVSFGNARFGDGTGFEGTTFQAGADFSRTVFGKEASFGPVIVRGTLSLNRATFNGLDRFDVAALWILGRGIQLGAAATLRVRWAQIDFSDAVFSQLTTLARLETSADSPADFLPSSSSPSDARPKMVSLRGADVGQLTLNDVDVRACRLTGVHNLEGLRLEGQTTFAAAPSRLGRSGRQALAEEHQLRAQWHSNGWAEVNPINPPQELRAEAVEAAKLASLYRSLRKGREDVRDAPGASDFYYGEMEMRRVSNASGWADRVVLLIYWLVSGYGLRASRSLLSFGLVVIAFSGAIWLWGLQPRPGLSIEGWSFALQTSFLSATSLLRPPPKGLSPTGEILDAILRLLGGSLLGLAVFSLRGRIKR